MEELKPRPVNSSPLTPLGFLDHAATVYGDLPSVVYGEVTYTWSQTRSRCVRLASALTSVFSISNSDVVSVLAPNVPAMYEIHFGVPMSGAVLNTLNIRLDARTLSVQLRHSESKLVFVDQDFVDLARQALSLLKSQDSSQPLPHFVLILENGEEEEEEVTDGEMMTYECLIEKGDPEFQWVRPRSEWAPMVLNYTSGTTSTPRGVVHCHRALYLVTLHIISEWSIPKQTVYLWILPMFHANGWGFPWIMAALGGVNICLRRFDASATYAAIERYNVTLVCCAPVVLNMLVKYYDQSSSTSTGVLPGCNVHIMIGGSSPPPTVLMRIEALGFSISHGYGQTESIGFLLTCAWKRRWDKLPTSDRARLKARQGIRALGVGSIDVIDTKTGHSVDRDGKSFGEIVADSPCVMLGYFKDPEATDKCIRGEQTQWLYTGDLAVVHPDGYIEIKDRSKDVIISGGENISSLELESVLYTHPSVHEAAVVARLDEFWGESPCAFVCLKTGDERTEVTGKEIMAFCRERLPHFMVPKTVVFKEELAKTASGKIKKHILREMAKELGPVVESSSNHGRPETRSNEYEDHLLKQHM